MKPKYLIPFVLICAGAGLWAAKTHLWPRGTLLPQVQATAARPAFSATFEETVIRPSENVRFVADRQKVALRADGSRSTEHTYFRNDGTGPFLKRELALPDPGVLATIFPSVQSVASVKMPKHPLVSPDYWPNPKTNCSTLNNGQPAGGEFRGESKLLGYRVFQYESNSSNSRMSKWFAPDLGCEMLHRLAEFRKDGQVHDSSELIARSITLNVVDEQMFTVPADYEMMPMGPLHRKFWATRGKDLTASDLRAWEQVDQLYPRIQFDLRAKR